MITTMPLIIITKKEGHHVDDHTHLIACIGLCGRDYDSHLIYQVDSQWTFSFPDAQES
jgi:hypothetical protein